MNALRAVALRTLLGSGGLLLVLSLMIWIGAGGPAIVAVHVALGVVLVLSLWILAAIAARSGTSVSPVAFAVFWGFLVLAFGLAQQRILPGQWHWTVQLTHLFVSMGAIWWGRRLLGIMRRGQISPTPSPVPNRLASSPAMDKEG